MVTWFLLPCHLGDKSVLSYSTFGTLRIPHGNNQDGEEVDFEESANFGRKERKKESKSIPCNPVFLSKDGNC